MALNIDFLRSIVGILKLVTLVIGVIDLGLVGNVFSVVAGYLSRFSIYMTQDSRDEYFLAIIIIVLLISAALFVITFLGLVNDVPVFFMADCGYHAVGGLLLLIGAIVWLVYTGKSKDWTLCTYTVSLKSSRASCTDLEPQRIVAGLFGLVNALIYFAIAGLTFKKAFGGLGAGGPPPPQETPSVVPSLTPSAQQVA